MLKIVNIAVGGAVGALLRYWVSGVTCRMLSSSFPWGTLAVNLIGSLIIGFLWGLSETVVFSQNLKLFVFIGMLGSFTTFSTFSLENLNLLRDGEYWLVFANISASIIFGLILAAAGFFMAKLLVGGLR